MNDTFSFDVFLSHNSADKPRVLRLAERLKDNGLRVWLDDWIIKPGDDIFLAVEQGLQVSRVLVLCLSPDALGSGWVAAERSTIMFRDPRNAERRFIPLLLADCELPDTLRRYKHVDYRRETNLALVELVTACRSGDELRLEDSAAAPGRPKHLAGASAQVRQQIARFSRAVVRALRKASEPCAERPAAQEIEARSPAEEERQRTEAKLGREEETQRLAETQRRVRRRSDDVILVIALTLFVALVFTTTSSAPDVLRVRAKSPFHVHDQLDVRIDVMRQSLLFCFIQDQVGEYTLLYPTYEAGERANLFGPADGEIKFPKDFKLPIEFGPMPDMPAVEFFHCIATEELLQGTLKTKWLDNTAVRRGGHAADHDVARDILSRLRASEGYVEASAQIKIISH